MPGTNLGTGVVNYDAFVGITAENSDRFGEKVVQWFDGSLSEAERDPDDVAYWTIAPEGLAAQISTR